MFGKPFNVKLLNCSTNDYVSCWREFEDSIVIIGIASGCSLDVLNSLLDIIFDAIVLIVGIDEVKQQRNVERLKREFRVIYPVIDRLLDSLDCGETGNKHASDILGYSEVISCPENNMIKIVLDSYTKCVDSMYSCVIISEKIAVATESWWSLHPNEIKLLTLLAVADNLTTAKDVPVFLPYKSAKVAFRFVVCTLMPDVMLCCLCGSTPALNDIKHFAMQCFRNSTSMLGAVVNSSPRSFPSSWNIGSSILSLLLVNIPSKKYTIQYPQQNCKKTTASSHRLEILRSFLYRTVDQYMVKLSENSKDGNANDDNENLNTAFESYWCSEYHKCYAIKFNDHILCILFNASPTTHVMRLTVQKCFKTIFSDKQLCW
ncbi:unnamed protein product [Acanthoscelides obtectus]|nr:unnamed protein product [Acanthoscelides obtectus]CAK1629349.1 Protein fuzzy homolog [Acanthoscelides obtectus]